MNNGGMLFMILLGQIRYKDDHVFTSPTYHTRKKESCDLVKTSPIIIVLLNLGPVQT